jgi:hypothetical protein
MCTASTQNPIPIDMVLLLDYALVRGEAAEEELLHTLTMLILMEMK